MLISIAGILLAVLLGYQLSKALRRPLQQLLDGTKQLQCGNFAHRINEQGPAEFAELARQFNLMSGYIYAFTEQEKKSQQATEQRVQVRTAELQQALAQLHEAELRQKQLLTDISHELRTPATSIQGEAEISLRGKDKDNQEYKEAFGRILASSQQLNRRIDDLLFLARGEERLLQVSLKKLSLSQFASQVCVQFQQQLHKRFQLTISPQSDLSDGQWLLVDSEKFATVLGIIADNAQHYAKQSDQLQLAFLPTDNEMVLELSDEGIGINPEDQQQLFTRHYRSAAARQTRPDGLGIGLSIAKAIMQAHDGTIRLEANKPQGTRVVLPLPLFTGATDENIDS